MTFEPRENQHIHLAMIVLDTPSLPAPRDLFATFASLSGKAIDPATVVAKEGTLAFDLDGGKAAVALMPVPIPWAPLEGPCETAWWWPEAGAKIQNHTSHLIVALGRNAASEGERDALHQSVTLTQLVAAVAAHVDAAGVFWGGGSLVHDPQVFFEEARHASPKNLPLHLWIDFRIEQNDDGTFRLFTTGMKSLGRMELEIPHSQRQPTEVFDFAYSIADYILTLGAEVRDSQTVGRTDDEKVMATHAPSMLDPKMTVLRLEF